jgi:hypothetical protein
MRNDLGLSEADRLREEDPYTGEFTKFAGNRIIARHSRFEVDLNRTWAKAVYLNPEDAWGLNVRRNQPSIEVIERCRIAYEAFYSRTESLFREMERTFGRFLVLDIHSYNHRRPGPDAPPEPAAQNPEINLGSSNIPEDSLPGLYRFQDLLRNEQLHGQTPDVRIDVKFTGGHFARWIHETFPESALCIAVEFRKAFMDEWTGIPDPSYIIELRRIVANATRKLLNSGL